MPRRHGQAEYPALLKLVAAQVPGETEHQKSDFLAAIDKLSDRAKAGRVQVLKVQLMLGAINEVEKQELRGSLGRTGW